MGFRPVVRDSSVMSSAVIEPGQHRSRPIHWRLMQHGFADQKPEHSPSFRFSDARAILPPAIT